MQDNLADDLITDLLRSSWIVEKARAAVYRRWAARDSRYEPTAARVAARAAVVAAALASRRARLDEAVVPAHQAWIENLAGSAPGEVPLGEFLMLRLGDWVEGHAAPFMNSGGDRLRQLGDEDRAAVVFPESMPDPPPFEPVAPIEHDPPGERICRFAILGDLHIGSPDAHPMALAAIADINASGADLVVQLGDITNHGEKEQFETATRVLGELEMPTYTMLGNHDVYSVTEERLAGREYYPSAFGREPDGILVEHSGVRFAVLDSAENAASPFSPFDLVSGSFAPGPGGAVVRGSLTVPQHEILADLAAPGSPPAFVFLHHPVQPFSGFPPLLFGLCEPDSGRLHATVDSGNVWGVFAGHTHRNALTRKFGSVPALEVGIPRDFPFGYAVVDVTERGYAYSFRQISDQPLLYKAYQRAGEIHRRYGLGPPDARGFVWTKPG